MNATEAIAILGEQFAFIYDDADALIQHLGLLTDAKILDVGTGLGYFAIALALRGYHVLTGEPASDGSIYAKRDWLNNAQAVGVDHLIRFRPFDAQNMPFADASFNAIFFFGVLHHVDEDARASVLQEAFRTAKPGGVISFLEPNQAFMPTVREHDPSHPEPADPIQYAHGLALSEEIVNGRFFDVTIFRKQSN